MKPSLLRPCLALFAALAVLASVAVVPARAEPQRIALVVGNAAYSPALPSAASDATLIGETLKAAGFDVVAARDLDAEALRKSFGAFVEAAAAAGPETVAILYFAGYGVEADGETWLLPVNAPALSPGGLTPGALRISDYVKALAAAGPKTGIVVLDAARPGPVPPGAAPGLAAFEPGPNVLLAYNAAPGSVPPADPRVAGVYAHALSETIREGGLPVKELFARVRRRVRETTGGAEIPWNSLKADSPFVFSPQSSGQPETARAPAEVAPPRARPSHVVARARRPAAAGASTHERVVDGALGAVAGALVGGPVGLVAGAVVGATAGPAMSSSWGLNGRR